MASIRWKAENIGRVVLAPVGAVQRADAIVAHERDADRAARARRRDAPQPRRESVGRYAPSALVRDQDPQTLLTVAHHHARGSTGSLRARSARPELVEGRAVPVPFVKRSYALTICCTSLWRTTSRSSK